MSTPNPLMPSMPGMGTGTPPSVGAADLGTDPLAALQQTSQAEADLSQQQAGATAGVMQQIEAQPTPQPDRGVMAVAPLLIGLAAVGGKAMGLHAQVMLGAMNGMVSGAMKGDQMGFEDNLKKYQLNQQKLLTLYSLQTQYYNEMMNAYKGQADAELKAMTLARELSNDQWNKQWKTTQQQMQGQMDQMRAWYMQQDLAEKVKQNDISDQIRLLTLQMKQMQQKAQQQQQTQATQQAINLGAQQYLKTGQLPSMGWGQQGASTRIAILNRAAEIASEQSGGSAGAVAGQSRYKAMAHELDQVQKMGGMIETWEQSANLQAQIVLSDSNAVARTSSPAINKAILAYLTTGAGDPDATKLENAVAVFSAEYAKVMSGQTGGQGVTDAARSEAQKITSAAMSGQSLQKVIEQEQLSMRNRAGTFNSMEDSIQKQMSQVNAGHPSNPTYKSLADVQAAYKSGTISYEDATKIAKANGWIQ